MSRDPKQATLVLEQGRSVRQWFRVRLSDGTVWDPAETGYTQAQLQVRTDHASDGGVLLLNLTTENGGINLGPFDDGTGTFWSGYLYVTPGSMSLTVPWGDAVYDLVAIHEGGDVDTVRRGPCVLIPATTVVGSES